MKKISLKEKIFIAGSTGMVGKAIKKILLNNNYGLKENCGEIFAPPRKELNLANKNMLEDWFKYKKPTVVILAAAKVGGILANSKYPTDFLLENLKIQTNVIETSWKYGVKRFLFLGSSCIYPKFAEQPIKEESLLTGSLESTNQWYAIAKIAGIKLCEALRIQYNFDAISLMPTNLYGPGDNYNTENSHVFASFIKKFYYASKSNTPSVTCWGTGEPFREFMHVYDLASAVLYVLEHWDPNSTNAPLDSSGKPLTLLNVGTGIDISIKDLADKISKAIGYEGRIIWDIDKPNGTLRKRLDVSRINRLGWKAKIKLEEGIRNTFENYQYELIKNV